ncbi:MAG TPA: hypothetical protein VMT64_07315, partial [Candidatus Binataceae bacterium]|nr:hypothetical protein [Candidatus Binataceae bacterium]
MQLWLQFRQSAAGIRRLFASDSIRLEVSSKCQLKCPVCPTAKGNNREGVVGWGNLSLESFKRFIGNHPHIRHIEISNWGEVMLNPELKEIIKCAYESGIELFANNGVNFNSARDDALEAMAKYRFRNLTIAIDGATSETYQQYR